MTLSGADVGKVLMLSGGVIEAITEARATVTVESAAGKCATGVGNVFSSYVGAWPENALEYDECERVMCYTLLGYGTSLLRRFEAHKEIAMVHLSAEDTARNH